MKNKGLLILFIVLFSINAFGQCEQEATLEKTGRIISTKSVEVKNESSDDELSSAENELVLSLTAQAAGASWLLNGTESPVLTVFVDEKYNQDLMLFAGAEKFTYRVSLGRFEKGKHTVAIALNETRSAQKTNQVKIYSLEITSAKLGAAKLAAKKSKQNLAALANSPIIYARPNAIDKFTDIPLITYYEIFPITENHFKIRYTTIFSNEDGGTQTAALMARWGRSTDIEWVYEIELKNDRIVSETYQGANHEIKNFTGKRAFGSHPLIYTVTDNNNFSDTGCAVLRTSLFPVPADLSQKSRETVMDENPWTYRLMAEELIREGRVNPQQMGANTIDDLRNYLFTEVYSENTSAAVVVEVKTKDGKTSRSDFADSRLRVDRSGYKRIAVRVPSTAAPLESLSIICQPASQTENSAGCQNARIVKFVRLDEKYAPTETLNPKGAARSLKPDERWVWLVARQQISVNGQKQ
jgi:hypothetical protein